MLYNNASDNIAYLHPCKMQVSKNSNMLYDSPLLEEFKTMLLLMYFTCQKWYLPFKNKFLRKNNAPIEKKKLFYMIFGISDILIIFFELIHFIHICKLSLNMINQKCIPVVRVLGPLQPVDTSHTFLLQSHSPWHLSYDTI